MKIYAYEVRDDEIDYFTQAQKKFDADIILKPQLLTCGEIRALEPHSAISILGLERCDKDELDSMAMQDIRYLATRRSVTIISILSMRKRSEFMYATSAMLRMGLQTLPSC